MKKFLKYTFLYLCVTVLTSVGIIFIAKPSTSSNNVTAAPPSNEEPTAFDMMLENLMSSQGFDLTFDMGVLSDNSAPMLINGQVFLDLSRGFSDIALQGNINLVDKLSLEFAYIDGCIYLTVLDNKYKINVSDITEFIDIISSISENGEEGLVETISQVGENNSTQTNFDVTEILVALQTMKDEKLDNGHRLSCELMGIQISMITDNKYKINEVSTGEIKLDGYTITPHINMEYVTEPRKIEINQDDYFDVASLKGLLQAGINTAKLKQYHITTTLDIKMYIASIKNPVSMSIPVDLQVKLVDNNPQIMAQIGPIPVIAPVDNDVPYKVGDTVSGVYCGLNRILNVYYADGYVYFYRSETVPVVGKDRTYEKMLKITLDEFKSDPLTILSYGCGFKDIIMNEIQKAVDLATNRENPIDITNVLLDFMTIDNGCSFVLNLKELANNPQLDSMKVDLSTSNVDGKEYITNAKFSVHMPIADAFKMDIECNDISLIDIGKSLDMSKMYDFIAKYPYKVDEKWHASKGNWELVSATTYTVSFEENGGEEVQDIVDAIDTEFELPTLASRIEDDGITRTTYVFDGWFTSSEFEESTRYTIGKVQRGDLTLYAKWNTSVEYYHDVRIVNSILNTDDTIHAITGSSFDLSLFYDDLTVSEPEKTTTYKFIGWYTDDTYINQWNGGNVVPEYDVTLYAKWEVINVVETRLVNIYDNGKLISSTGHEVGEILVLPSDIKILDTTKFYVDANYSRECILPERMPNNALEIHIRNIYTVTIIDDTCHNDTIVLSAYQGEQITLPNYESIVIDDGSMTQCETYTFFGFDSDIKEFANNDIVINAVWNHEIKYYYNVTFSKDNNIVSAYKSNIEFPIDTIRVLEGSTIDLSQYVPKWEYTTGKLIKVDWHYDFEGWSTKKGGDNVTEITVSADTTIYANWDGVVKPGKA